MTIPPPSGRFGTGPLPPHQNPPAAVCGRKATKLVLILILYTFTFKVSYIKTFKVQLKNTGSDTIGGTSAVKYIQYRISETTIAHRTGRGQEVYVWTTKIHYLSLIFRSFS